VKKNGVGIRSLAIAHPEGIRTNDYYRERFPEVVARSEEKNLARFFSKDAAQSTTLDAFATEMIPYLRDTFRGTVERRILRDDETSLGLELRAARSALAQAKMLANDIDLMIVTSFPPDQYGVGNAAYLARELEMKRPAWNMESACAGSVVALQTACGLVQSGMYRNILIVASCTYSRISDERDSLTWFLGDGAGAFVVGQLGEGQGILGASSLATTETCNTFYLSFDERADSTRKLTMHCAPDSGKILHETAELHLRQCCEGAAKEAGVLLSKVDFVICNTPMAWYSAFVARALGIDPARTINTFPKYGNIGAASMPANLHEAAATGKIKENDLVLLYAIGSVSSASAIIMRWGDVKLAEQ
jgi:3-oxoacyl-[acyl-carrier-protein] synthase-3